MAIREPIMLHIRPFPSTEIVIIMRDILLSSFLNVGIETDEPGIQLSRPAISITNQKI